MHFSTIVSRVTSCLRLLIQIWFRPRCNQIPRGICLQTQVLLSSPLAVVVSFLICFGLIWGIIRWSEKSWRSHLWEWGEFGSDDTRQVTFISRLMAIMWSGEIWLFEGGKFSTFVGSPYLGVLKSNAFYPSCWSLMFDLSLIGGCMI